MKIQRRIFFSVLIFIILINIIIFYIFTHSVSSIKKTIEYIKVNKEHITYEIPFTTEYKKSSLFKKNQWQTDYFDLNIGKLQISIRDYNKKWEFYSLMNNFFKIKINKNIKSRFFFKKFMFYCKLKMFNNGALIIKKISKQSPNYIYVFTIKDKIYWFSLIPSQSMEIFKDIFDKILLSIEAKDKSIRRAISKKEFAKELSSVCMKSYFLLCQSFKSLIIFISIFMIMIFSVVFLVMASYVGKLPNLRIINNEIPLYKEEKVDILLKFKLSRKFSTCAFLITSNNLIVYKFKKEFINIELLKKGDYSIKTGKNIFNDSYIEIAFTNMNFIKPKFYNKFASKLSKITIRLYSKNTQQVFNILNQFQ